MKIVLASSSPRRKELLSWLVDDFAVIPSGINEETFLNLARTPEELVVKLAQVKAKDVAEKISDSAIIVGGDSIVVLEIGSQWQVLNKPRDKQEAKQMLSKLRGQEHTIFTGICALCKGRTLKGPVPNQILTDFAVSKVTFKNFSDKVMDNYVETEKPMDKAGAYGIQEVGDRFVKSFQGSYTNIIGLPVKKTAELLTKTDIKLKSDWRQKVKQGTGYED